MDAEEKKLQIKLAQLQTDVQIWLALCLGCVAICGGLLIGGYQLVMTPVSSDMVLLKNLGYSALLLILIADGGMAVYSVNKMQSYRDAIDKL